MKRSQKPAVNLECGDSSPLCLVTELQKLDTGIVATRRKIADHEVALHHLDKKLLNQLAEFHRASRRLASKVQSPKSSPREAGTQSNV